MAQQRDLYEVLGLSKSATDDEIKKAYRKLAKQYHPDINKEKGAEDKFKEVQHAYDILSDTEKRQLYDQYGHAGIDPQAQGGPGGFGGFGGFGGAEGVDLGDIFGSFFGGGRTRQQPRGPRKGDDVMQAFDIEFMDSINGLKTEIRVGVDEQCSHCKGSGAENPSDVHTCNRCNGRGVVDAVQNTILGQMRTQTTCPSCQGKGKTVSNRCTKCGGDGYTHVTSRVELNIPAGINSGQQLRVSGKGERGVNGGPNGDLYIEVRVRPHKEFKRQGNDIHLTVPVTFVDATLGTTVDVPTVYGDVSLNIPEGTQPATVLRLREKGVKDIRTGTPGDQYVHIDVKTPSRISKDERDLYQKLRDLEKKSTESLFDKFKKTFKRN